MPKKTRHPTDVSPLRIGSVILTTANAWGPQRAPGREPRCPLEALGWPLTPLCCDICMQFLLFSGCSNSTPNASQDEELGGFSGKDLGEASRASAKRPSAAEALSWFIGASPRSSNLLLPLNAQFRHPTGKSHISKLITVA